MSWEYEYDESVDETTIYWGGEQQAVVSGELTQFKNGVPLGPAREAVAQTIQNRGRLTEYRCNTTYIMDSTAGNY